MRHRPGRRPALLGAAAVAALQLLAHGSFPAVQVDAGPVEEHPWRLGPALGLPDWLEVFGEQRTRYESLDEAIRADAQGSNQLFALRTLLTVRARGEGRDATVELIDSRQLGAPDDAPLSTAIVDAVDLLQAYVGIDLGDALTTGDRMRVQLGRQTMDVGSRRFVARNRYRNTINSFTGLDVRWTPSEDELLRAFWVLPIPRVPTDPAALLDNEVEFDEERSEIRLWGLFGARPDWIGPVDGELYVFGFDEEDTDGLETRDRELVTVGSRLVEPPRPGGVDLELELALQFGEARASTDPADTEDLDVFAGVAYLEVGKTFDSAWHPRLAGLFEYGSGDADPDDGDFDRFDPLFGARNTDFGQTDIFGPFGGPNHIGVGYELHLLPDEDTWVMFGHRFHYLASDRDAWVPTGLVDPTGSSGRYLGNLVEMRFTHELVPGNLALEGGVSHLFAGDFVDEAPNASGQGDSTHVYLGLTVSF